MNNQDNINFYGCLQDYVFSEPYAVLPVVEIEQMVRRCQAWITMIETHPNLAAILGDEKNSHIKMVTALPTAIQSAKQGGTYPKIVFPQVEFQASMKFFAEQEEAMKLLPKFEF